MASNLSVSTNRGHHLINLHRPNGVTHVFAVEKNRGSFLIDVDLIEDGFDLCRLCQFNACTVKSQSGGSVHRSRIEIRPT